MFTTKHFKINEQIENVNANLKIYLRVFVNYKQNNWINFLFVIEFEINSIKNVTIDIKSFITTKNYFLRSNVELFEFIIINNVVKRKKIKNANKLIAKFKNLQKKFRVEIKWIQIKQKNTLIDIKFRRLNSKSKT